VTRASPPAAAGAAAEPVAPAGIPDPVRVLYVAGAGRSGSTVLANLLGEVPGFVSVGEVRFLWERGLVEGRLCGCGVPVPECPFWTRVLAEAFGEGGVDPREMMRLEKLGTRARHVPAMLRARSGAAARAHLARMGPYGERLARLYRAIRSVSDARVVVDSSKLPGYGFVLGLLPAIDLRVVHLVRDPRATAFSWLRLKEQPDRGAPGVMRRKGPSTAAALWTAGNGAADALWSGRRAALRLRYEDFTASPGPAVDRVLELAGEPGAPSPLVGERTVELGVHHTVAGNPDRLRTGRVELRADREWRGRMRGRDRALVTALTWPLLLRYGYLGERRDGSRG
jgi:hypothetical protein